MPILNDALEKMGRCKIEIENKQPFRKKGKYLATNYSIAHTFSLFPSIRLEIHLTGYGSQLRALQKHSFLRSKSMPTGSSTVCILGQ